jgi:ubiquinone/menaquinone biosynthesis C-methylase UbiE
MKIGDFDTDSRALKKRIDLQEKLGFFNLNEWIFANLNPKKGSICLDLGCGQGNQSLPLAKIIGNYGSVTALDVSKDSLTLLKSKTLKLKIDNRVKTIQSELDDIEPHLKNMQFDRIVGSYSLYYVRDAVRMFSLIESKLKKNGRLFFCGPSHRNNMELRELISKITGNNCAHENTIASKFMEYKSQEICSELFYNYEILSFDNPINFKTPESVMSYWKSHNLYQESYELLFEKEILKHFELHGQFTNTKRGIGISCIKNNS